MLGCVFNLVFIQELLEIDSFGYRLFCDLFCMNFTLKWGFGVLTLVKMKISSGMLWCSVWYLTTKAYGVASKKTIIFTPI